MNRVPVALGPNGKPGNVKSIGYDPATKTLEVEFAGGSVYQYDDVPPEVHAAVTCEDAERSVGSRVHARVVKGGYQFRKVQP